MLHQSDNQNTLSDQVSRCFDQLFLHSHNTRLIGGSHEPVFIPADYTYVNSTRPFAQICFTHDYVASALHEVAHWCIAGKQRRQQLDYGYWYAPDGRTQEQQIQFEQAEVKPQALEWIFSAALGIKFRVSADNLQHGLAATPLFKSAIYHQVLLYLSSCLPPRAALFSAALCQQVRFSEYVEQPYINKNTYQLAELS